jgi:hypothetical protein
MPKAIQNSLRSYFLKWVGKSRIPLSFIPPPPLLSCKRGSGSCKEWKKWERKENSSECSPNLNSSISIPPCLTNSHRGYFSTLSSSSHQGHLHKFPSLFRLHLRADGRQTILSARPHSSWTHGATQITDPSNSTTLILITLKLILLFICKRPHIY